MRPRNLVSRTSLAVSAVFLAAAMPSRSGAAEAEIPSAEIVIGTHVDLSGPLATWGTSVRNGISMAVEETNGAGGIGGRKLKLAVRDDRHDDTAAALAVRLLAERDHVFAVLSPLGTPKPDAAIKAATGWGLPYLFPVIAGEGTDVPPVGLQFSLTPPPGMEVREGLRRLLNARANAKVGLIVAYDEFGRAIREGVEGELKRRDTALVAMGKFDESGKDLEEELAGLKARGVDLLVVGAEGFGAIKILSAAASLRWKPAVLCSSACYLPEFSTLAGADAEGLYSVGQVPVPYPDDPKLGTWVKKYEDTYSAAATVHALTAYRAAHLFFAALNQAGPNPTPEALARVLETRGSWTDPMLGGLPAEFSRTDHLGSHTSLLTQIRRGRWVVVTDPAPLPAPTQRPQRATTK